MKLETVQSMTIEFFSAEVRFPQVINRGVLPLEIEQQGKAFKLLGFRDFLKFVERVVHPQLCFEQYASAFNSPKKITTWM